MRLLLRLLLVISVLTFVAPAIYSSDPMPECYPCDDGPPPPPDHPGTGYPLPECMFYRCVD